MHNLEHLKKQHTSKMHIQNSKHAMQKAWNYKLAFYGAPPIGLPADTAGALALWRRSRQYSSFSAGWQNYINLSSVNRLRAKYVRIKRLDMT